jgi:hypothetical protein
LRSAPDAVSLTLLGGFAAAVEGVPVPETAWRLKKARELVKLLALNFLGDAGAARTAYGTETYTRLVALRRQCDPTNVFRLNQNIVP